MRDLEKSCFEENIFILYQMVGHFKIFINNFGKKIEAEKILVAETSASFVWIHTTTFKWTYSEIALECNKVALT